MSDSELERIAKAVADRCHGSRKPGAAPQRYATIWQAARLGAIEAEAVSEAQVKALREALERIYTYCNDTLSGRADGGFDDREWQRAAVIHARNVAREFVRPELHATLAANKIFTQPGAPS